MRHLGKIAALSFVACLLAFPAITQVVSAQVTNTSTSTIVNVAFPCPSGSQLGACQPSTDIPSYLNNLYKFAVGIAGALAVAMIVAGGVYYTVSAGSSDKQREAKSMITSAIWGLILLFASYLILRTINPQIVSLSPQLTNPGSGLTDINGQPVQKLTTTSSLSGESVKVNNDCGDFKSIPTNPRTTVNGVDETCSDRVFFAPGPSPIIVNSNQDYDETVSIAPGSKVWQYPYYATRLGASGGKDCLIYAFHSPSSSSTYMIKLQDTLSLCAPKPQNTVAQNTAECSDPQTCAAKYNEKYPAINAPDLTALISCIGTKVPEAAHAIVSTIDQSHPLCNQTRGNPTSDPQNTVCSHAVNSCHYGGRTGTNGAEAADYGRLQFTGGGLVSAEVLQRILDASLACGAKSARCETDSPATTIDCSAPQATHVHVNAPSCDAN